MTVNPRLRRRGHHEAARSLLDRRPHSLWRSVHNDYSGVPVGKLGQPDVCQGQVYPLSLRVAGKCVARLCQALKSFGLVFVDGKHEGTGGIASF